MVFPGKITLKGGAVFAPSETRPQGAPLTVILGGKDARHGGWATSGLCRHGHRRSVTAGTADLRVRAC